MTIAPGRTPDPRTVTGVGTTNGSSALTAPAAGFSKSDVGRPVSGTGIPVGTTFATVTSATSATLSTNATATATITLTIGRNAATDVGYGFTGWSPESDTEKDSYSVAAVTSGVVPPDRITNPTTGVQQRKRS